MPNQQQLPADDHGDPRRSTNTLAGREGNVKVVKTYDAIARRYDNRIKVFERFVVAGLREWAVTHATGRTLEIAVGSGLNLPLYPPHATSVLGVDLSEEMLNIARRRIAAASLEHVTVRRGDVQALDLPDNSVDSVVSTFTFCTIPDPLRASTEALRVLVPGGRIILAEHGPATHPIGAALMRALDPLAVRLAADHITRDPQPYLEQAGFHIEAVHRGGRGGVGFRVLARKPE